MEVDLTKVQEVRNSLHTSLAEMGSFSQCVLLDYPSHLNIGDQLIGLGEIYYFNHILKTKIKYMADWQNFSSEVMADKLTDDYPIVFHGGGNLGDLWPNHQRFRQSIIQSYPERPIIILPQTIYFRNQELLEKSAKIFNSHTNLTLFVRDKYSYELGQKYFDNCKIILSPDMAFQLVDSPRFDFEIKRKDSVLYFKRTDAELNKTINLELPTDFQLVTEDWVSFQKHWKLGNPRNKPKMQLIKLYREIIQRGLLTPQEFLPRRQWIENQIEINNLNYLPPQSLDLVRLSLSLTYSGIRQLKSHRLVISTRLHGHILCLLLGIPNIFLSNSYYKNQGFYEAWTHDVPFSKFVQDVSEIPEAIESLSQFIS
jgi:pyruvyl transferase EpsO